MSTEAPPAMIAIPPPLSRRQTGVRTPGLWAAAGLIALYFALQAVMSTVIVLVMTVATGYVTTLQDVSHIGAKIRAMLDQPGMPAVLVMLTLGVAACSTLLLTYRTWPQLWSQARPPGLGFALPLRSWFLVLAIAVGLAAPVLGGWLTVLLAHGHKVTQDIQQLGTHTPLGLRVALVLVVATLGPLVEELLFRGVLLSALLQRWHAGWSVTISALVFALVHLPGLQFQWYALPDLTLLALALAWLRLHSGSIWPAVVAHGVNNLLAVVVWFVASNPPG
jgi:uncharacterized protein